MSKVYSVKYQCSDVYQYVVNLLCIGHGTLIMVAAGVAALALLASSLEVATVLLVVIVQSVEGAAVSLLATAIVTEAALVASLTVVSSVSSGGNINSRTTQHHGSSHIDCVVVTNVYHANLSHTYQQLVNTAPINEQSKVFYR